MTAVLVDLKRCRDCRAEKPLDAFHAWKSSPDGRRPRCKPCRNALMRERYHAKMVDPAWRANRAAKARTAHHRRWQDPAYQERIRAHRRALRARDPERHREATRRWRAENYERWIVMARAATHKRKAQKRDALIVPFTAAELEARLSMFPGCWMCGEEPTTIDHVKPLSKGGAHALANLRPACGPCNMSKRDRWPFVPEVAR